MLRQLLIGSLASLLAVAMVPLVPLPGRSEEAGTKRPTSSGSETYTSDISEVDACNRAQMQRPADTTVTGMRYWRVGGPDARATTCRISWSDADDAQPTNRPILFGRSS